MRDLVRRYWRTLTSPSAYYSLGFLTIGGFVGGIVFWGAFNTVMEFTNREQFCIGCHVMRDNVYQEIQPTIHFTNRSGVRAKCVAKRRELAEREWARFKANDSLECRNCHEFQSMDFTRQSKRGADAHS